jgi:hypothetical protein
MYVYVVDHVYKYIWIPDAMYIMIKSLNTVDSKLQRGI